MTSSARILMKWIAAGLGLLMLLAVVGGSHPAFSAPARPAEGPTIAVTLRSVTDGDTIEVTTLDGIELTIRILGIDTPETWEKVATCPAEIAAGQVSKAALQGLLGVDPLTITLNPGRQRGHFKRHLARVTTANGTDVSTWMLRHQHAVPYGQPTDTMCR